MNSYLEMDRTSLENELNEVKLLLEEKIKQNIKLDMSRGKPGKEQLLLSSGLLTSVSGSRAICSSRHSCRSCAPIPAGSNCCSIWSICSTTSGVTSIYSLMDSSSLSVTLSLRSRPSSSSEPMRYCMMICCTSSSSYSPICSRRVS